MNPDTQLATTEPRTLAVQPTGPSTGELLAAVVREGITPASVEVMERLCALREREETRNAEREFAAAFVRLQQEIPTISGTRGIPDKSGTIKFRYANFDDIDAIVRPICLRHGFSYSFAEKCIGEGRVTVVMTLSHAGGHSRQIPYSCRIGSGPPGANESQADGSGHTYAQRGAIESGLALRIVGAKPGDDARNVGGPISPAKAREYRERCAACGMKESSFLKFAHAGKPDDSTLTFEDIGEIVVPQLEVLLRAKEKAKPDTSLAKEELFK